MTDRKTGDLLHLLPTDDKQSYSKSNLEMFNRKKEKYQREREREESDSDSEDEDIEDDKKPSVWNELKSTFIASFLFAILSIEPVDDLIRKMGLDGIKVFIVKLFIFAIIYFILRYKFL